VAAKALALPADVQSEDSMSAAADKLRELGPIDLLSQMRHRLPRDAAKFWTAKKSGNVDNR